MIIDVNLESGVYSVTFEVLTEDLHLTRSAQSTAVSNITWGYVQNREAWLSQWLQHMCMIWCFKCKSLKAKQVNMGCRIEHKMIAGRKYERKYKFECLHFIVRTRRVLFRRVSWADSTEFHKARSMQRIFVVLNCKHTAWVNLWRWLIP
jgi:hypothetical protein